MLEKKDSQTVIQNLVLNPLDQKLSLDFEMFVLLLVHCISLQKIFLQSIFAFYF